MFDDELGKQDLCICNFKNIIWCREKRRYFLILGISNCTAAVFFSIDMSSNVSYTAVGNGKVAFANITK